MAIEQIGTYHLSDNPQLFEIQRNNNYVFSVPLLGGPSGDPLIRAGAIGTESNAEIKNASELLRLSVSSAAIPHFSQEAIEIKRGNSTLRYAGVPNFEAGSFQFHDFIGAQTKDILMAWQNLSYDVNTEKVASLQRTNYKRLAYLIEYPPDYYEPVRTWKLYGCWISAISEDSYTNDNGDKHMITATIQYDRAQIDLTSVL